MKELRAFTTSSKFPPPPTEAGDHLQKKSLKFERTSSATQWKQHEEKRDVGNVVIKEKAVIKVDPRPRKNLASTIIDHLERVVIRMHDTSRTAPTLIGNFGPVTGEIAPVTDLPVTGNLPECLNGAFMRVGPNPLFTPLADYHWFDGDGMIHSLRIKNGKATYVSRFVKTSRLQQEEFFGTAKFGKIGDLKGLHGLLMLELQILRQITNVLDTSYGFGTANTAIVYHNGSLLALNEGDKPYVIKLHEDGDIETVGLLDYDKKLDHPFTAHPKIDPVTGELFCFGYQLMMPPYLIYRVISKDGVMRDSVPITISHPVLIHDFAITENYAIFMDLPVCFKPKKMITERSFAFKFDNTKNARFGVLPRYAKNEDEIRWFELPCCFILHTANAWEEGEEVVMIVCRLERMELEPFTMFSTAAIESFKNQLYEMRFNMKTGEASQKELSVPAVDFPRINEKYMARKQRYVYTCIMDNAQKIRGVAKFDLEGEPEHKTTNVEVGGNIVGVFELGNNRFGSEVTFVPRVPENLSEEDDGYLVFFLHDETAGKSFAYVIDARTMSAEPVAVVELPERVPFGFHATFVSEEQIKEQINLNYIHK